MKNSKEVSVSIIVIISIILLLNLVIKGYNLSKNMSNYNLIKKENKEIQKNIENESDLNNSIEIKTLNKNNEEIKQEIDALDSKNNDIKTEIDNIYIENSKINNTEWKGTFEAEQLATKDGSYPNLSGEATIKLNGGSGDIMLLADEAWRENHFIISLIEKDESKGYYKFKSIKEKILSNKNYEESRGYYFYIMVDDNKLIGIMTNDSSKYYDSALATFELYKLK